MGSRRVSEQGLEQEVPGGVDDELFALLTETGDIQEFLDGVAVSAARRLSTT